MKGDIKFQINVGDKELDVNLVPIKTRDAARLMFELKKIMANGFSTVAGAVASKGSAGIADILSVYSSLDYDTLMMFAKVLLNQAIIDGEEIRDPEESELLNIKYPDLLERLIARALKENFPDAFQRVAALLGVESSDLDNVI